jgi:hypothetical protein
MVWRAPLLHMGGGLGKAIRYLCAYLSFWLTHYLTSWKPRLRMAHKLRGRGTILRTSLYVDDAAMFVASIKQDIQNLSTILHNFGMVIGLCINWALLFPLDVETSILMTSLRASQPPGTPSHYGTFAYHSRFRASIEGISNILKINAPASSPMDWQVCHHGRPGISCEIGLKFPLQSIIWPLSVLNRVP